MMQTDTDKRWISGCQGLGDEQQDRRSQDPRDKRSAEKHIHHETQFFFPQTTCKLEE